MLIESTRDSLCFTVTHYKHSKQQYSIQVRGGPGGGQGGGRPTSSARLAAGVTVGISQARAESLFPPRLEHAHVVCLRPVVTSGSLSCLRPGQNRAGEAELDAPHQEAHPGEPPHHHPPEGALLGCPPQLLRGCGERVSFRASCGFIRAHPLDTGITEQRGSVQRMPGASQSTVGGPRSLEGGCASGDDGTWQGHNQVGFSSPGQGSDLGNGLHL